MLQHKLKMRRPNCQVPIANLHRREYVYLINHVHQVGIEPFRVMYVVGHAFALYKATVNKLPGLLTCMRFIWWTAHRPKVYKKHFQV